jgi:hypothetical protein
LVIGVINKRFFSSSECRAFDDDHNDDDDPYLIPKRM